VLFTPFERGRNVDAKTLAQIVKAEVDRLTRQRDGLLAACKDMARSLRYAAVMAKSGDAHCAEIPADQAFDLAEKAETAIAAAEAP
jgi:hypothetical protein